MRDPELVERLIREAVETAEYGLGRDGCPFCGRLDAHDEDCIAKAFGARDYEGDVHPERQESGARPIASGSHPQSPGRLVAGPGRSDPGNPDPPPVTSRIGRILRHRLPR